MTQAQVDQYKLNNQISKATQTGDLIEFCVQLNKNKRARLYYSESYKDYVLAFNINQSKSFILNRSMWKKFKKHFKNIDNELGH
jgi:hypothetical protein